MVHDRMIWGTMTSENTRKRSDRNVFFSSFSALSDVQEHQTLDKNIFEDLAAMAAEIEDLEEMAVTKVNAMKGPSCRKFMRIERDHRNGFHMFNEHM